MYPIHRNAPGPEPKHAELRATLRALNVDDEFFSDCKECSRVQTIHVARKLGIRVSTRKDIVEGVDGYWIRRIE